MGSMQLVSRVMAKGPLFEETFLSFTSEMLLSPKEEMGYSVSNRKNLCDEGWLHRNPASP